ncbi:hypothetical protein [Kitasatospora cheerisanensis]|uniref:Uncharacterized protein n=1 Tax=Kitasatospora cheerisanensis KCTC 2395 TaxID=1348663 RepID=A0A066YQW5_9ACTN|nr:hypothetical protein [Kitasatospora cheerisanensis]KDN80481.1 hypothetical protein KCH_77690 [Kitasatospora cheerisanensis KCTC 2395]
MTPAELQSLLISHLPTAVPGIEAAEPWTGRPYGLVVTAQGAGTVYWTVTGASNTAPAAAVEGERLAEQPTPDLPGGGKAATGEIEQALLTALAAGAEEGHVLRAERYSTRPVPPGFRYGLTVDCADGWRLFATCVGTSRRGEKLAEHRHYKPDETV